MLEALLKHRAPVRVGDIAKMIDAPRSTTYEIVNSLLEAEMLENVGIEGHVYFGRAMHLFGWAYGHHNAHYRRIIETMERIGHRYRRDGSALRPARQQIRRLRLPRFARAVPYFE